MKKIDRLIYGPAYLDLVMRVGQSLAAPGRAALDKSVDGCLEPAQEGSAHGLRLLAPDQKELILTGLDPRTHPTGTLHLSHPVLDQASLCLAPLEVTSDLGGMGAGFAAALQGVLVSALGSYVDEPRKMIENALRAEEIVHRPVMIPGCPTDWTLIVSSGPQGDKLPVGLRGCHARLRAAEMLQDGTWGLVVAASLPNPLLAQILQHHSQSLRVLAPAMRNCRDQATPLGGLSGLAEIMCLNQHEWDQLQPDERQAWLASNAIVCVTYGSQGAEVSWRDGSGSRQSHHEPVFPRSGPPVDTNRAGEAFAAFFLEEILSQGWSKARPAVTQKMIATAARAGAAAAGLTINLPRFGFPTALQLQRTLELGHI